MMTAALLPEYEWRGARGRSLVALVADAEVRLDPRGARASFSEDGQPDATCIEGARILPSSFDPQHRLAEAPLRVLLERACGRLPASGVALALSGGLDSAVLAALLGRRVVAYTLTTDLPSYGEEEEARSVAAHFGIELRPVRANEADFVGALDAAVAACERPLYNLHPVGRFLLARAARADGVRTLVTGDGADEAFRGQRGADYLPVVGSLARAAGCDTYAPFLEPDVAPHLPRDPEKRTLRICAEDLGVKAEVALRPKRPRYTPPIDLSRVRDWKLISALARALGLSSEPSGDRERVGLTTLALLARRFPGLRI